MDSLVDGIKELNLRADEWITTGSGAGAEAFQRLGYDATTLKDKLKDPSALFTEIIGKLEKLDRAAQIRIADEVFGGTGGEKFVQLIEQGEGGIRDQIKAANDLGIVLDQEVIRRAAEIDKKFNAVSNTVSSWIQPKVIAFLNDVLNLMDRIKPLDQRMDATINADLADLGQQRLELERRRIDIDTREARGDRGMGDGYLGTGVGETDFGTARQELQRDSEALAENERRIMDVVKARQAENTAIAESPITEDRASRFRGNDAFTLPGSVGETPTRRIDPYFDDATGGSAGKKIGDSIAVAFIKKFEGFREKAYWDTNAFRAGYGSDTTTRESGNVERVNSATMVSLADANRDLARRIAEFQAAIRSTIGNDTWASFSEEQQAALTSIAYNYGQLPDRIVKAIESGNPGQIGEAIRDLGDDNGGINRRRRSSEADLFYSGSGGGDTPAIIAAKEHKKAIDELNKSYDTLGNIGIDAAKGLAAALADGKLEGEELLAIVTDILQKLLEMPEVQNALSNLFGGGGGLGGGGGADPWAGMRSPGAGGGGLGSLLGDFIGSLFGFAGGTSSAPGGPVRVNESGRGEIMDLPSGTRVIPHDISKQMATSRPVLKFDQQIINATGATVRTEQDEDREGNIKQRTYIEEMVTAAASRPGSPFNKHLNSRGARKPGVRR